MKEQIPQPPDINEIREKIKKYLVKNLDVSDEELYNDDVFDIENNKWMAPGEFDRLINSPDFEEGEIPFIRREMAKSSR